MRLLASVQRFRCRDCGETFLQPLGAIQEAMRMTERCAEYVKDQCLRDTFTRIAEHVGCDEKTIRTLASEHIKPFVRGERSTNHMLICPTCHSRFHTKPHAPSSASSPR